MEVAEEGDGGGGALRNWFSVSASRGMVFSGSHVVVEGLCSEPGCCTPCGMGNSGCDGFAEVGAGLVRFGMGSLRGAKLLRYVLESRREG